MCVDWPMVDQTPLRMQLLSVRTAIVPCITPPTDRIERRVFTTE